MIAGSQMRAARALMGMDQRVLDALTAGGVELIADGSPSAGLGCSVRLIQRSEKRSATHVA